MENTFLLEMLERRYINSYREELEKDYLDTTPQKFAETSEALEKSLNEEQLNLFKRYLYELDSKDMYIKIYADARILNYGIKIGMILQEAFDEYDNF